MYLGRFFALCKIFLTGRESQNVTVGIHSTLTHRRSLIKITVWQYFPFTLGKYRSTNKVTTKSYFRSNLLKDWIGLRDWRRRRKMKCPLPLFTLPLSQVGGRLYVQSQCHRHTPPPLHLPLPLSYLRARQVLYAGTPGGPLPSLSIRCL